MALPTACCLLVLLFSFMSFPARAVTYNQSHFFTLMKQSLSGDALSSWHNLSESSYCNLTGISCNEEGFVVKIDISEWALTGHFPADVCTYLPALRVLQVGFNNLHDNFPDSITNCTLLEELNMTYTSLMGTLPNLSPLKSLRVLDLSYNLFRGDFPMSVTNLTDLEFLNFNENGGFNLWQLPENISQLAKLKIMILSTCMIRGQIPATIGNMTSLVDFELSGNYLTGKIPPEIGILKNLKQLELYYNELVGSIPEELGNLTELTDVDISVNLLTGKLPESLCKLPKLEVLQLYNNSLTGEIPGELANSTTLRMLSLYDNFLTGEVPQNLGLYARLVLFDISENQLSGHLPPKACSGGKLLYFLVLQNSFSGKLPEGYGNCESLLRFRVSSNNLEGSIPQGILGLPHASIIDLAYNHLEGPIAKTIGYAKNLSELFLQSNRISGVIPPEISLASNLVKIDLSNNLLSGPVPDEIGNLKKLNLLMLQGNKLNSSIPKSLSTLKFLNVLDLSNNLLTGHIPESLCELLPNSINFSNNLLSGPIPSSLIKGGLLESFLGNPDLCISIYLNSSYQNFSMCSHNYNQKRTNFIWVLGLSTAIVTLGIVLFLKRWINKRRAVVENDDTLSSSFFSYNVKSFHRISFDQREIVEAMVDKNIVGHGGSGTVYRIKLSSGEVVAVKKLWSQKTKDFTSDDQLFMDKELKTEVETLGNIRHKNIVKLYSYFSETKEGAFEVLDKQLSGSFKDEMIPVLRIAIRCTCRAPILRPTMNEVVQMLIEADPCRFDSCKSSNKTKEISIVTKTKFPYEL
ncbi:Leucine-rich repeat [Dillenia turbinata]|uniref:Leucine-rich repeat n=1 Tax=Dillenia turbinata TaxID=194707 RepID=A0AAN8ZJW5_9MAGN